MNCIISKVFTYYPVNPFFLSSVGVAYGEVWVTGKADALKLTVDQARVLAGLIPGSRIEELKGEPKTLRDGVNGLLDRIRESTTVHSPVMVGLLTEALKLPDAPAGVPVEELNLLKTFLQNRSRDCLVASGKAYEEVLVRVETLIEEFSK